jgi:hypothetical protein
MANVFFNIIFEIQWNIRDTHSTHMRNPKSYFKNEKCSLLVLGNGIQNFAAFGSVV